MVSAIVLLTVERDKINKVAEIIADIEGVSEVYSIAGRYDLAAQEVPHLLAANTAPGLVHFRRAQREQLLHRGDPVPDSHFRVDHP